MRLRAVIRGRVQGVGFRWFVREAARSLDLSGHVLNRPDGCVEVEAEGTSDAIERLRRELADGPRGAHVESVEELHASELALEHPFSIVR
jgi:acylphosphatase